MKRKLDRLEQERLDVRDEFFVFLYTAGCRCLWVIDGPDRKSPKDICRSQLRAYVIRNKVHVFHLYPNGGMDVYGPCGAPLTWDELRKWVVAENVAAKKEEKSTPLTIEPM